LQRKKECLLSNEAGIEGKRGGFRGLRRNIEGTDRDFKGSETFEIEATFFKVERKVEGEKMQKTISCNEKGEFQRSSKMVRHGLYS